MWQITYQRPNGALWMFGTQAPDMNTALRHAWRHIYGTTGDYGIYWRLQVMAIQPPWDRILDTENEAIRP